MWSVIILSGALMFADNQRQLEPAHQVINYVVTAIYSFSHVPLEALDWGSDTWASHQSLLTENQQLKQKLLFLAQKQLKFKALEAENLRLKSLLRAAMDVRGRVKMAEIVGINPDPFTHEVLLNRGTADGIRVGQPLLGSDGLIGQIIAVTSAHSSRALLISDANHALPVQINRNGVRAIAVGSGHLGKLYLAYLPDSADVKVGDLLVSSGLGGRFPFGYPVATVTMVKHDPGAPFATAEARPKALLDRLRHVLILVHQDVVPLPPPGPWPTLPPAVCAPPPVISATNSTATTSTLAAPVVATPVSATAPVQATSSTPLTQPSVPTLPTKLPVKPVVKPVVVKPVKPVAEVTAPPIKNKEHKIPYQAPDDFSAQPSSETSSSATAVTGS